MRTAVIVLAFAAIIIVLVLVMTFVIALIWYWVVPDVFAGAVEQSILPGELSLVQAFKLAVLLMALGLTGKASSSRSKS